MALPQAKSEDPTVKVDVFWDAAPCSLAETERRFQRKLQPPLSHHPDDGASELLRNITQFIPDYMAQQLRRQLHS